MSVAEQTGGFPDWGRFVQNVSDPILVGTQTLTALSTTFGPFFVGGYPCSLIRSRAGSNGNDTTITLSYYADEAVTQLVGTIVYFNYGGNTVADGVGNLGPWMTVRVSEVGWTLGDTINLAVVASMASVDDLRGQNLRGLILQYNGSVPAGNVFSVEAVPVTTGPAVFNVNTAAASWSAQLVTRNSAGTTGLLLSITNTTPSPFTPYYVALPARPVWLQFTNNDATTQTFSATLIQAV